MSRRRRVAVARAAARCRVLVAEDIPDAAEMMRLMIECMGHDVRVAADGVQAVAIAQEFDPQIALLDIGMPRMDGYEAASQIRAALGRRVFLVALTGWGQEEDQRRAHAAGFDRHLTKPAEPAILESLIASVAEYRMRDMDVSGKHQDATGPLPSATPTETAHAVTGDAAQSGARISLTPGQRLGHYRILRFLGEGGMGEVYEAEDDENGRRVALKTVRRMSPGRLGRARFLQEGRLAASISHPNVVYVFGTEEIDGIPVIATEIATGGTFKDRVMTGGRLTPALAIDWILQLIAGLEAAADAGVLHRDVKPSNCFTDGEGRVKIGDFGLAISTDELERADLTLPGTVLGTPAYASPEQMRGQPVDVQVRHLLGRRDASLVADRAGALRRHTRRTREHPRGEGGASFARCIAQRPATRSQEGRSPVSVGGVQGSASVLRRTQKPVAAV